MTHTGMNIGRFYIIAAMLALLITNNVSIAHAQQSQNEINQQLNSSITLFKQLALENNPDRRLLIQMYNLSLPAAEAGIPQGQLIAGWAAVRLAFKGLALKNGDYYRSNMRAGIDFLELAAEKGLPLAQSTLFELYTVAPLFTNLPRSSIWFDRYGNNSSANDNLKRQQIKLIQRGVDNKISPIISKIKKNRTLNNDEAYWSDIAGSIFFQGALGYEPNSELASRFFEEAVKGFESEIKKSNKVIIKSYLNSATYYGYFLASKQNDPKSNRKGLQLLRGAEKLGSPIAREIRLKLRPDTANDNQDKRAEESFGLVDLNLSPRQGESEIDYNLRLSLVSFLRAQYFMTKALGLEERVALIQNTIKGLERGDLGAESSIKKIVSLSKSLQDEIDKKMKTKANLTQAERELFVQSLPNYFHGLFRLYRLVKSSVDFAQKSKDMIQANWISAFGIVMQALKVFDTLPSLLTRFQSSSGAILTYATSNGINTDKIEKTSEGLF